MGPRMFMLEAQASLTGSINERVIGVLSARSSLMLYDGFESGTGLYSERRLMFSMLRSGVALANGKTSPFECYIKLRAISVYQSGCLLIVLCFPRQHKHRRSPPSTNEKYACCRFSPLLRLTMNPNWRRIIYPSDNMTIQVLRRMASFVNGKICVFQCYIIVIGN